jgi:hypothetical protein
LLSNNWLFEEQRTWYPYKAERMIPMSIQAFDWNCPQHITLNNMAIQNISTLINPQNGNLALKIFSFKDHHAFDHLQRHNY